MALSDLLQQLANQRAANMPTMRALDPTPGPVAPLPQREDNNLASLLALVGSGHSGPQQQHGGSVVGNDYPDNPRGWIREALDVTNHGKRWVDELYQLMMRESGGDPHAINNHPVASGEHAKGLFQTIPSTFRANRERGLGGIFNPVANAASAFNYIWSTYGNPNNLPSSGGY